MSKILAIFILFISSSVCSFDVTSVKGSRFFEDLEFPQVGKGVAVSKDVILTALHIVKDDEELLIPSVKFKGIWLPAVIIAEDSKNDLVLLQVKGASYDPVEILAIPQLVITGSVGQEEVNPIKARNGTLQGFVSRVDVFKSLPKKEMVGGLSGSPATVEGRLVGIVSAAYQDKENINLVIIGPTPIEEILKKLPNE